MEQPDRYIEIGKEDWVWKLHRGLYSLVQELNSYMTAHGYMLTAKDPAIYMNGLWDCEGFMASGFWVDDFIGVGCPEGLMLLGKGINDRYGVSGLGIFTGY